MKRVLTIIGVLLVAGATPAFAQQYPPGEDAVFVSDTTVVPGEPITISAQVFQPGSTVTFVFESAPVTLGTATANANGVATLTVEIPSTATPGPHTITASGTGADGNPLSVVINITVVGARAGAALPVTGSQGSVPLVRIGAGLLAAGGIAVLMARKRRARSTA